MAFNKYSLEKLPSGRLGEGGMKNEALVATAARGSFVAVNRDRPSLMIWASNGSSTVGSPSLILRIFSGSMSTPSTRKPRCARVAAMQAPSLPSPNTDRYSNDLIERSREHRERT